ncbi:MAG: hypothetical protein H6R07_2807 [Proteobacteria bacterium]|nr:hypothetical protein [Pseudomonadota bacterium]
MQLKKVNLFANNKPMRYSAIALVVAILGAIIVANRTGWSNHWFGNIKTETTIDCPELEKGCAFNLNGKPFRIKSDIPLEPGKPFLLDIEGEIVSARAFWRMVEMDMGPNNYRLEHIAGQRWQAKVTLPPCPHGGKDWQLHLELNARAADINTRVR